MSLDSEKARQKIESIEDLPTLPSVVGKIIEMANSPRTNARDVGKLIEQDQALTSKVLKLVNSAFYGFPGQIKSVQHAVVIMGFNKVKNVVMAASIFDLTKGRTSDDLDIRRFWEFSLGSAIGAKVAAKHPSIGGAVQPDDAFVAGLIHCIGELIMALFLRDDYLPVLQWAREKHRPIPVAEKEVLGFTNGQVGGWIAEKWRLPPMLNSAIRHYMNPMKARDDREMATAVHLGHCYARALLVGNPGDGCMVQIDQSLWKTYGFDQEFLDQSLGAMIAELRLAQGFLDLIAQ